MTVKRNLPLEQYKKSLHVRGTLLLLQLLLPFGLYLAMKFSSNLMTIIIAGLFVLSMFFLVWLG